MGWMKRGGGTRKYYCRKVRTGCSTRTIYIGGGAVAELEARRAALHQFERELARQVWNKEKEFIFEALDDFRKLDNACNLLRDAVMLTSGFLWSGRRPWKESKYAKRYLDGNDAVGNQGGSCRGEAA